MTITLSHEGETVVDRHRRIATRRTVLVIVLAIAALLLALADVVTGPSDLGVWQVVRGIVLPDTLSRIEHVIVWDVRLPAAAMAALVGAALSVAGVEMQTVLDNPLSSPFTLGVSSAAALGAAIAIVLNLSAPGIGANWIVPANAFVFALASVFLLQLLARAAGNATHTLILFGIALQFSFNALVALVQFYASQQSLQQVVFWMMGSLQRVGWTEAGILAAVLALLLPFTLAAARHMTLLRLGEERALSFGVDVRRLRFFALVRISLLTGTAVAFVGTIGFVGLVGPHIARLLIGEDHRLLVPASALTGALLMAVASILSKLLVPGVALPIGIVTAIAGVPVFVALILHRSRAA
ncbi:FecCD family ABC transporter permease [Pararhizobium mangrovi]|uniref:Iron ABC transporter permease n=1 Tax=Pararhizobium mangrovi TaxID=2590452 RepID=A0A506U6H7_9HYPH|nr:iron ABC transporter permease [Pararhizobium mangrovi]TPW28956.1 iron ABC transporter permease [Pararhizobium mangrovi]